MNLFQLYTPAAAVDPRPVRSNIPKESVLAKMFPLDDMVDWVEKNSITADSVEVRELNSIYKF